MSDLATACHWGRKSTSYLSSKNTMGSDYGFTKIWVGKGKTEAARTQLISFFDNQCRIHDFKSIDREDQGAHFTFLLADAKTGWLHFDAVAHYFPYNKGQGENSLQAILSKLFPVVSFFCSDDAAYNLQRWEAGQVVARYTSSFFMDMIRFKNPEKARQWYPVYADWKSLLTEGITEADFLQALPPPIHKETMLPKREYKPYNYYPETYARLFGWEEQLNGACIAFNPEGNPGRGDFSKVVAGDYTDTFEESGGKVIINARHYAHPNPGKNYFPTWDEDMGKW